MSRWKRPNCWQQIGISAEVVDPRTTVPLDKQTLIESAKKTSRAIVVDEGYEQYGVTAEIASVIADGAFYYLDAPVKRMGAMNVPIPFSPVLEDLTIPTPETCEWREIVRQSRVPDARQQSHCNGSAVQTFQLFQSLRGINNWNL